MLKKYRINYFLHNTTLTKLLDFYSYNEAEQHVKEECEAGFHKIYNGKIQIIPSDNVLYFEIIDNDEFEREQERLAEIRSSFFK